MNDFGKLGYLYILRPDQGECIANPRCFMKHCLNPVIPLIGDNLYWFGWNEEVIFLPGRSNLHLLKDDKRLDTLSYFRVFSKGADVAWQLRGNGNPIARLCLETDEDELAPPAEQLAVWWKDVGENPFFCHPSRRILIGKVPDSGTNKPGVLFELRYPRAFIYEGIRCGKQQRVKADVYEYLDMSTRRLTLVRYRSIGIIEEQGGEVR